MDVVEMMPLSEDDPIERKRVGKTPTRALSGM